MTFLSKIFRYLIKKCLMSDVSSILVSDLLPQENFIIPTVNLSVSSRVERVHDIVKQKKNGLPII
jgi:hypothetical protein